jgi:serine/threonine-protein kinase
MARFLRRRRVAEPAREVSVEETAAEPRRPLLWPWLVLLLVLVLAGLGALWWFQREDDKAVVPEVVGLTVEQATERLAADGFSTVVERQANEDPPGQVFAQEPGAGSQLDEGETVRVLVSTGPAQVEVPDVVGSTRRDAETELRSAGFEPTAHGVFSEQPVDEVVAQDPPSGERVERGAPVRINYSKGTGRVAVPDVVGRTSDDAGAIIREAGLVARPFEVPSPEPEGTVVAQNPQPGAEVAQGDPVRINVSSGESDQPPPPAQATVPNVVGQQLRAAQDRLQGDGFVVRVAFVESEQPVGRVVAQTPAGGASAKPGSNVRLDVSVGPDPPALREVPNVVGLDETAARSDLEAAGFAVRVLTEPTPDPSEVGVVVRQEPQAGRRAPEGVEVTIYLGEQA